MNKIVYLNRFGIFSDTPTDSVASFEVPEEIETLLWLSVEDFEDGVFVGNHYYTQKYEDMIFKLKQELEKYKEDVEQVELFGMDRDDYEQKKSRCAEIIIELRKLEKELEASFC